MDEKYTWDFGLIYKSFRDLEKDIEESQILTQKIKKYEGKLNNKKQNENSKRNNLQ